MKKETVSIYEAMAICGVSRRSIYNWMEAGKVTVYRTPGGAVRLLREELLVKRATREAVAQ